MAAGGGSPVTAILFVFGAMAIGAVLLVISVFVGVRVKALLGLTWNERPPRPALHVCLTCGSLKGPGSGTEFRGAPEEVSECIRRERRGADGICSR